MKQYTHAWISLMAFKRICDYKDKKNFKPNTPHGIIVSNLVEFLREQNDDVVQGSWFPDSIIKDNSTGHILRHRKPQNNYEKRDAEFHAQESKRNLPSTSEIQKYIGTSKKNEPVVVEKRDLLADRCQAIVYSIRDELKIQREVAIIQKNIGSPIIPRNNQISLLFFMISHYIADGHMPLHCDARKFKDSIHSEIEQLWENEVKLFYEMTIRVGTRNEKKFLLDKNGLPILAQEHIDQFQNSILSETIKKLDKRRFIRSFGEKNNNVWDYMVDVCFFSYLLSTEIFPHDVKPQEISKSDYKLNYESKIRKISALILADTIDSIARIWLHCWTEYRKLKL